MDKLNLSIFVHICVHKATNNEWLLHMEANGVLRLIPARTQQVANIANLGK
jgi:hypothetical protein